jgi:F0F1-type ATP synthase assembly protein I
MPLDSEPNNKETPSPVARKTKTVSTSLALAMELPFVLVGTILVGGLAGFFLDRWLHTKPILTLVLGSLGFFAGVREVLRRLPGDGDGKR